MRFNSKSVTLNRGVNHRVLVQLPDQLSKYQMDDSVWEDAVQEFNKKLDKRPLVTIHLGDTKVDVLKIGRTMDTITLWLVVKEKDLDAVDTIPFTIKGEVIFAEDSDTKVDKMIIQDLLYDKDLGIFSEKS